MSKNLDVFVCGHRKSGTSLLVNLLDSHSQLSVCPFDLTIFYGYFPNEDRFDDHEKRSRLQSVIFENWVHEMSANKYVDISTLEKSFFQTCRNQYDISTVFHALLESFQQVTKQKDRKYRISKETSLEMHATTISDISPGCKFIHVVRNPLDNLASLLSGLDSYYSSFDDDYLSLLHSIIDRVGLGLRCGIANTDYFGKDRYMFVRYEDIVQDTSNTLNTISDFIGVPFDPVCLQPSVLGHQTPGNSFVNRQQFKVTDERIGTHKKQLSPKTSSFVCLMLAELMKKFDYHVNTDVNTETLQLASYYYDYVNKKNHFFDRFQSNGS